VSGVDWSDGAHAGLTADEAMQRAVGGGDQPPGRGRTPAETRVYLLSAQDPPWDDLADGAGYSEAARWVGKRTLEAMEAWPELRDAPMESSYDWDAIRADPRYAGDPVGAMSEHVLVRSVTDRMREDYGVSLYGHGLSGFQVGFGVNMARYALGLPEQPNPALLVVSDDDR
jgi:hypothetical protein